MFSSFWCFCLQFLLLIYSGHNRQNDFLKLNFQSIFPLFKNEATQSVDTSPPPPSPPISLVHLFCCCFFPIDFSTIYHVSDFVTNSVPLLKFPPCEDTLRQRGFQIYAFKYTLQWWLPNLAELQNHWERF